MIDLNRIRLDKDYILQALHKRGIANASHLLNHICLLDKEKRAIQSKLDSVAALLNKYAKEREEQFHHKQEVEIVDDQKNKIYKLKEEIRNLTEEYKKCTATLMEKMCQLPNLPHESVPIGNDSFDNQILYQTSIIPGSKQGDLPHWELVKKYNLVDFELGNKITGSGFPLYKGKGAKLQRALINFFLDKALQAGYIEVQPPILVNEASAYATGQLPDKDAQMYYITKDELYMIPTAEIPITNMYRNCIISEKDLPIKHVGYTPCFRREAGSWGAHVRGLNRLHQFDKVELVQICHPDHSYNALEEMRVYVQGLIEELELPYRVLKLCTGDLGFCASMTYDIEVYSVVQNKWLEVSSISNFENFQSNRLMLRYKEKNKKSHALHTLNGSALALPRIVAALLEVNQSPTAIVIPKALHLYTGFDQII